VLGALLPILVGVAHAAESAAPVQRLDELWEARLEPTAIPQLVEVGERTGVEGADDFELAWRVARGFWWLAFAEERRSPKQDLAHQGMQWGERARSLNERRVEGHLLYALALGEYAEAIGIAAAVLKGLDGKFTEAASKAYEIDRDFEMGGPITAIGRYHYRLPWPKRDLDKSRRYLEEGRERHPRALLNRLYLAETYHALGDTVAARRELESVLGADPETVARAVPPPPPGLAAKYLREWFGGGE
jgi:tetratricopeptide (TPR) repeat protein